MNLRHVIDKQILKAEVDGRLDTNTAEQFREYFSKITDGFDSMIIDLKNLDYVSSSGLRQFLTLRKKFRNHDDFRIINCSPFVMDIFHSTGFDEIMNVSGLNDEDALKNLSFEDFLGVQVKEHGDRVFICDDKDEYTWRQIDQCAQVVAEKLIAEGVKRNSHVGIYAYNSVNWIIAFFAIQKLGGIAMLINPALTYQELIGIMQIGDISHVCIGENIISDSYDELEDKLKNDNESFAKSFINIRKDINLKKEYEEGAGRGYLELDVDKDDACVMIFSSGTTGKPKGVLLSAYNILNSAETIGRKIRMSEYDVECLVLPLFHIFGFMACAMKCALYNGKLVMPADNHGKSVIECIEKYQCTIFNCVPTTMLAIINNKYFDAARLKSLRSTMLAGAPILKGQMLNLMEMLPENNYSVSYGLSEMAPVSMTEYEDSIRHLTETVGKPVDDIEIRIFDTQTGKDCLPGYGGFGEILVRGYNLMCAYYKRDIQDQSVDEDDWLHTGDLGYLDEENYLHIVGRSKELIIRGGENIVPNEVAGKILTYDNIVDAKVIGIPDEFYGEIVGVCLVLKDIDKWNKEELVSCLENEMAKYKIPACFRIYDEFPLLSNGKADMLKLKEDLIEEYRRQG